MATPCIGFWNLIVPVEYRYFAAHFLAEELTKMAAQVPKKYSLFQRAVRLTQTSMRAANNRFMDMMPGMPNPPELEEELRRPTFVDLWEFTLADHRRILRESWEEYKASFDDADEIDVEQSKQQIKEAADKLRGHVKENTAHNAAFLEEKLEGTRVLANVKEIGSTAIENAAFLKGELTKIQQEVDPDAVIKNVQSVVQEHRSQKDVVSTLTGNVEELVDLVKTGRDAALKLDEKDVDHLKEDAQSWFADKLTVAQSVLVAFIDGYKEGKQLELERKDAILLTYARQAAQEQSAVIKEQLQQFIATQKEKQQQREKEQQSATTDSRIDSENSSSTPSTPTPEHPLHHAPVSTEESPRRNQ